LNRLPFRFSGSLISLLFVLSGLTSLIYEIVWSRILSTILGNTSLAISIVVSIFMAGLAIGSFVAARSVIAKKNPLLIYALLELFIGLYSVCTPFLANGIENLYGVGYAAVAQNFFASVLLKALISAVLFLLPTIAMGATLPMLLRLYPPEDRRIRGGVLYGLNTAGAVCGTILAGYALIPSWGIKRTILWTACCNVLIALMAFRMGKARKSDPQELAFVSPFQSVYLLFFLTGFATLSYEILWTRALSMFFGSSVYAFSAILAAFLLGIAAGSSYYAKRIAADADPYQFFSLIQFRLSLAAVFFIGIFMGIPFFLIKLFHAFYDSFPLFQVSQFILIGCSIFYATFLSGAAFPAALHFFRNKPEELHAHAGNVYTYNTAGSILGSFCAAFLLIPNLGVEFSIRIVILINLILGIICFRRSNPASQDKRVLAIGGVSLALLLLLPQWDQSIYNAGFYAFAYKYVPQPRVPVIRKQSSLLLETHTGTVEKCRNRQILRWSAGILPARVGDAEDFADWERSPMLAGMLPDVHSSSDLSVIFYGEGLTATVAVVEQPNGIRSLLINGKPDASNVPSGDMRTQLLLAHLPILIHGPAEKALVIGLGSGVTSGALSTHGLKKIDCVEIEKKVAEASRFYEKENGGILHNKNFHLIFDDGRNFVSHTQESYDVITSEPSNLWMSGVANLFTREFFLSVHKRLRPGGVICQWIHLYQISPDDILVFLKTFHSVFPHLGIWIDGSDMLLVGADQPVEVDLSQLTARMSPPAIQKNLTGSNLTPTNILEMYIGDERLVDILRTSIPLNTDDHPILEFSAPKSLFANRSIEIVSDLRELRKIADMNR